MTDPRAPGEATDVPRRPRVDKITATCACGARFAMKDIEARLIPAWDAWNDAHKHKATP